MAVMSTVHTGIALTASRCDIIQLEFPFISGGTWVILRDSLTLLNLLVRQVTDTRLITCYIRAKTNMQYKSGFVFSFLFFSFLFLYYRSTIFNYCRFLSRSCHQKVLHGYILTNVRPSIFLWFRRIAYANLNEQTL